MLHMGPRNISPTISVLKNILEYLFYNTLQSFTTVDPLMQYPMWDPETSTTISMFFFKSH